MHTLQVTETQYPIPVSIVQQTTVLTEWTTKMVVPSDDDSLDLVKWTKNRVRLKLKNSWNFVFKWGLKKLFTLKNSSANKPWVQ